MCAQTLNEPLEDPAGVSPRLLAFTRASSEDGPDSYGKVM
jgi:hypothetical protein